MPLQWCVLLALLLSAAANVIPATETPKTSCGSSEVNLTTLANGKSYFFGTSQKSWSQAKEFCESNALHLASPKTAAEFKLLYGVLKASQILDEWWVSATNQGRENSDFRLHDGEPLPLDSTVWDKDMDEPSNYLNGTSCAYITIVSSEGLWDNICTLDKRFICECGGAAPEISTTVSTAGKKRAASSEGLTLRTLENGKKYYVSTDKRTWSLAKQFCEDNALHLASPKTVAEFKLLNDVLKDSKDLTSWWVSLTNEGRENTDFRWHDGEQVSVNSTLWDKGMEEPSQYLESTSCAYITKLSTDGLWDYICTVEKGFLCEQGGRGTTAQANQ